MSFRPHRGLIQALRESLQQAGVGLDSSDVVRLMAGINPFRDEVEVWVRDAITIVLDGSKRFDIMRQWESDNEGVPPFAPPFPERVLRLCAASEDSDEDIAAYFIAKIRDLAENELKGTGEYDDS